MNDHGKLPGSQEKADAASPADLPAQAAAAAHDQWVAERLAAGSPQDHPFLTPFTQLPVQEQERCLRISRAAFQAHASPESHWAAAERPDAANPAASLVPQVLRDLGQADLGETLGFWQALKGVMPHLPVVLFRELGHHTLRLGEPLLAYDMVAAGLERFPGDIRLRQLMALALLRSGATLQALGVLDALYRDGCRSEETLGLLARAHKDLAEQATDATTRTQHWRQAQDLYAASYEQTGGYWSGINAATMARLLGEAEKAQTLALRVRDQCRRELDQANAQQNDRYWLYATLGEAALVRGQIGEALEWYGQAGQVVGRRYGDLASTRRNARLLMDALGLSSRLRKHLDNCLKTPRIIVFAGHMIDQPGRFLPRFPPTLEGRVARAIAQVIRRQEASISYSSAACGADILFLEAMLARQGEINIVLPFGPQDFRKTSVDIVPGGDWGGRFEKVLRGATRVVVACEHRATGSPVAYEYANLLQDGLAVLRARMLDTDLAPVVVWDGRPGDGPGGTASLVEHWLSQRRKPEIIDLAGLLTEPLAVAEAAAAAAAATSPAPPAFESPLPQEIRAMLFADVVGFSRLQEEKIPGFMEHFMGAMQRWLAAFPTKPLSVNTWGDALHCVFATVREAGIFALGLRDRLRGADWQALGLPGNLNLRISLHAGPVFVWEQPAFAGLRFSGSHVSRAARIEPITPPGQVYASQQFAALASSQGITDFMCDYVGQIPLPKQAGIVPLYLVRRPQG